MTAGPLKIDGPDDAPWTLVLAHGAGAPMDHPFLETIATTMAEAGVRVVRFEFPYMQRRRTEGVKAGPNPIGKLQDAFRDAVSRATPAGRLAIGGKSMGGRVASMLADELGADALVVFGYPFHAPGKPEKARTAHLEGLATPALILQGTRDPFGTEDDVAGYTLSDAIAVHWLADGDHGFKPRKASGHTLEGHLAAAASAAVAFLEGL